MDPINIRQLAERLNLSVSTISKAFRSSYDINPQTRERVLAMAKELNYQPNLTAASLRTQKSKTLAVIIPAIDNTFFVLALKGIETRARQEGYHVLIYLSYDDRENEAALTQNLQRGRIDGVLMSIADGGKDSGHLLELKAKEIPVVFFDRVYDHDDYFQVTSNDQDSAYAATEHLIGLGCRRIAHLTTNQELSIAERRRQGYTDALRANGYQPDPELVLACSGDQDEACEEIRDFLERVQADAIFSSFEKLALLSYQACNALGLRIPEDIRVISFSNLEIAPLLRPSLSTITQAAFDIGQQAAALLIDQIEKRSLPATRRLMVNTRLEIRESTAGVDPETVYAFKKIEQCNT
jgi:LacI family transcriptional regulator